MMFNIYIDNVLVHKQQSILETLLKLNLLDSSISIELLNKYDLLTLSNYSSNICISRILT